MLPCLLENIQATLYVKVPWFERNSTAAIRLLSPCITPWGFTLSLPKAKNWKEFPKSIELHVELLLLPSTD